jgi:hypothetical protein
MMCFHYTLDAGALFRVAFVASCFPGVLPPLRFRAVCLVRQDNNTLNIRFLSMIRRLWKAKSVLRNNSNLPRLTDDSRIISAVIC